MRRADYIRGGITAAPNRKELLNWKTLMEANNMDILDIIAITQAAYIAAYNANAEDKNNE